MKAEWLDRLAEFDTPTVCNGCELLEAQDPSAGYTGPDVRALMPEMGVRVGIAVTTRLDTTSPGTNDPGSLWNDYLRLIQKIAAGGQGGVPLPIIAIFESVGLRPRYTVTIGDGMATVMRMAGVVGLVTNGSIRDLEGVRGVGLPCWAAGLSPMHGRMRWLDIGSPIVIDGMTVRTGDVVHADVNGIGCFPAEHAERLFEKAAQIRQKEQTLFAKLRAPGMNLEKYLNLR